MECLIYCTASANTQEDRAENIRLERNYENQP